MSASFIDNQATIGAYLPSGLQVQHWVLLMPYINSRRLHETAKEQTDRLRAASVPYAASDVRVSAHTLADYEPARQAVIRRQTQKLNLPDVERTNLGDIDDERIDQMHSKLQKVSNFTNDSVRERFVTRLLNNHVSSRAQRDWIQDQLSELGASLDERFADLEQRLSLQYPLLHPDPTGMLQQVLADTEKTVADVLNTSDFQSRTMAEGQIAQWLMDCPLDFQ